MPDMRDTLSTNPTPVLVCDRTQGYHNHNKRASVEPANGGSDDDNIVGEDTSDDKGYDHNRVPVERDRSELPVADI
jgi:hypothetical protein